MFDVPTLLAALIAVGPASLSAVSHATRIPAAPGLPAIVTNDNRRPSGTPGAGTLTLNLRASEGEWRPEGQAGPALRIEAFGETDGPLMIPAPLVRVTEGVEISATVRNDLAAALRVHGLCERGAAACDPMVVPAGETRAISIQERAGRHLSLLGDDDRHAASVPRRRRHAVVGRVRSGSDRRDAAGRSRVRDHRLDGIVARRVEARGERRRSG